MTAVSENLYSVPLLGISDILETLNDVFNLDVKKIDLNPGNTDKLIEIYVFFLEQFGYDIRCISQPNFKCLPDWEDEMESTITIANLYSVLNSFLKQILCKEFCIGDILHPSFRRTQVVLSHILNYWKYCSSRELQTQKCLESHQYLCTQKERLVKNAPLNQRKMNDLAVNFTELQQANKMLEEDNKELRVKFAELMAKKEQVHKQSKEAAAINEKLNQTNQRHEQEVQELRVKLAKLEEKILDSPKHLQLKVEEKNATLAKLKSDLNDIKKNISSKSDQKRHLLDCKEQVLVIHRLIKEISDMMASAISLRNEIKSSEHKKQAVKEKIVDLDEMRSHYLSALSSLQEQMTSLEIQHKTKIAALKSSLKEAKTNESNIRRKANEIDVVVANKNQEHEAILTEIKRNKAAIANVAELSTLYSQSLSALDEFHINMESYTDEAMVTVKELIEAFNFSQLTAMNHP